ncbi:MAG: hypothetical protein HOO96_23730, partial [Polyangiaceae bacterium]|nr:hypothetical protein [Polyangiaceae bacterium]
FTPPAAPIAESVVGSWFSSDGSVGTLIVLGANHHYVDVSTMSGTIPAGPGLVREVTASWAGDGSYVSIGNVLARFPLANSKSPYSVLVRRFEQANTAQASGWLPTYCQLRRGTTSPFDPYEHCLTGGD